MTDGVRIEQLTFSRKDRARFVDVEFRLNRSDPLWAPPLKMDRMRYTDPEKNPFFSHADVAHFVAVDGKRDVGRIAAVHNHQHAEIHGESVGFFGFLELPDRKDVLGALLAAAEDFLKGHGLTSMRGPVSYDMNNIVGALVEPFDSPPRIMMPYNRAYVPRLLVEAGFSKAKDVVAWDIDGTIAPDRIRRISDRLKKRESLEIRALDKSRFDEEVNLVKSLYNRAWEKNWGFVPLTDAEIDYMAEDLRHVYVPDLVLFALAHGEPVGFCLSLPDANEALMGVRSGRLLPFGILKVLLAWKHISRIRVLTLGTVPEYRNRGVEILFYREAFDRAHRLGFGGGECSWILEDNEAMNKGIEACGGHLAKRYRIYERALSG